MIDVLMCLIVFYLIVGNLAADRLMPMDLPRAQARDDRPAPEEFVINVRTGDSADASPVELRLEMSAVTLADLEAALVARIAENPATTVLLRADRGLVYAHISPIIAACRRAGAATVNLAVEAAR
jgi:biopolymer transport protein ExbD